MSSINVRQSVLFGVSATKVSDTWSGTMTGVAAPHCA